MTAAVSRALMIASAAELASTCKTWRSSSENNPSPPRLLSSSIAPTRRSLTLSGAHRMDRVWKPVSSSTALEKSGSRRTSRTIWQWFSWMLRPTIPWSGPMRSPVMLVGPKQARQTSSRSSASSKNNEAASASR